MSYDSRPPTAGIADDIQVRVNAEVWRDGEFASFYDHVSLLPAEALILARYCGRLTGRVLDVGCGAGRILNYLVRLGAEAHGIDISEHMVQFSRRSVPAADVRCVDLADIRGAVHGRFDAILMTDNVLDVFDDAHRRAVLSDLRELLTADGLLIFSSHNLAAWEQPPSGDEKLGTRVAEIGQRVAQRPLGDIIRATRRLPRRVANHRRLAPLQYRAVNHAVVNDSGQDYALLHYYITRADQERQLTELGYALLEALELSGAPVPTGQEGATSSLYYVAALAA
ncbi:MAG: class I SAM-dependent methyltransferase [Solirubrobacterales bacterium]|nr:class I SAM-dependent methyltransferase [Solirubrobacterales bacterium]